MVDLDSVLDAVKTLIRYVGDDPNREGLLETPDRVARAYRELFAGYGQDPAKLLKTFTDGVCDEMVVLRGVQFFSTCEHHMMPFYGVAHIGYLPNGRIVGLSKLARLVEVYSRRLQVQERLTTQITSALAEHLKPLGAGCVVQATHSCMSCRGVLKQDAIMVTSSLVGAFKDDSRTRSEFLGLIQS
jgi:GTP cyclohydrolase I